jgi:hypothetical protein
LSSEYSLSKEAFLLSCKLEGYSVDLILLFIVSLLVNILHYFHHFLAAFSKKNHIINEYMLAQYTTAGFILENVDKCISALQIICKFQCIESSMVYRAIKPITNIFSENTSSDILGELNATTVKESIDQATGCMRR